MPLGLCCRGAHKVRPLFLVVVFPSLHHSLLSCFLSLFLVFSRVENTLYALTEEDIKEKRDDKKLKKEKHDQKTRNLNTYPNEKPRKKNTRKSSKKNSPIDLVKTRLQAPLSPTARRLSALETARAVSASSPRGALALWAGVGPSAARAAVQTASQCAAYDSAKRAWRKLTGAGEGTATHLAASAATGLVTTTCTAPIDVVKTKMMVSVGERGKRPALQGGLRIGATTTTASSSTASSPPSLSPWTVARDLVRTEGPTALLKGWTAQYVRLGPQTVITFLVLERLRKLFDLPPL